MSASNLLGRWVASGFGITLFLGAALVMRVHHSGEAALAASEQAFDAGDLPAATNLAREALTWYLPAAPHTRAAAERLRAIALGAEATGDRENAIRAWAALRGALFETSHPWSSSGELFREASDGVRRLLLLQEEEQGNPGEERGGLVQRLTAEYQRPARDAGRDWFASAASSGMALMLICGTLLASKQWLMTARALSFARAGLLVGVSVWLMAAVGY